MDTTPAQTAALHEAATFHGWTVNDSGSGAYRTAGGGWGATVTPTIAGRWCGSVSRTATRWSDQSEMAMLYTAEHEHEFFPTTSAAMSYADSLLTRKAALREL